MTIEEILKCTDYKDWRTIRYVRDDSDDPNKEWWFAGEVRRDNQYPDSYLFVAPDPIHQPFSEHTLDVRWIKGIY